MRWVVVAALVVSCGLGLADELPEDTNEIKTLTVEQAEILVRERFDGSGFNLDGLRQITPEVLEVLLSARARNDFGFLGGWGTLEEMPKPTVPYLQRLEGFNYLLDGYLSLDGLESLQPEAATLLAERPGIQVSLGLETLLPSSAKSLALVDCLSLHGLKTINLDVAKSLATWQGRYLVLNGLEEISTPALKELCKSAGGILSFDGLASLSTDQANEIVNARCVGISFAGIKVIKAEAASLLAKANCEVYLPGLTALTSVELAKRIAASSPTLDHLESLGLGAAAELAKTSYELSLNSLKEVSADLASELAACKTPLSLNGITSLSEKAANALATCRGELSLEGLKKLTSKALAAKLAKKDYLSLPALTELNEGIAAILSGQKGSLSLDALTTVSDSVADELSKWNGDEWYETFSLKGLTSLSHVGLAEDLIKCCGRLELPRLKELTPEVAGVLCELESVGGDIEIRLDGLEELSSDVAAELARFRGILFLPAITRLSEESARSLSTSEAYVVTGLTELSSVRLAKKFSEQLMQDRPFGNPSEKVARLKEITPKAAEELAKMKSFFRVPGLDIWNDVAHADRIEVVKALASHKGWLSVDFQNEEVLTEDLAEILSAGQSSINFSCLQSISIPAARILAKSSRPQSFPCLTKLDANLAAALAGPQSILFLSGLTEIDTDTASNLANVGVQLSLSNLANISDDVANELANTEGRLFLPSIKRLHNERLAKNLVDSMPQRFGDLTLGNLESVTPSVAGILSGIGGTLGLDGLKDLSVEVAEKLAECWGNLSLNSLTSLSAEAAEKLAECGGDLSLNGLTSLTAEAAKELAGLRGVLELNGLTSLEVKAAEALAACSGELSLTALQSLESTDLARKLISDGNLGGYCPLRHVSPEVGSLMVDLEEFDGVEVAKLLKKLESVTLAKKLIKSDKARGGMGIGQVALALNQLKELSPEVAEVLASNSGSIELLGLTSISPEAANALASHTGDLYLTGLRKIDLQALQPLLGKKGGVDLSGLVGLEPKAVELLKQKTGGVIVFDWLLCKRYPSLRQNDRVRER